LASLEARELLVVGIAHFPSTRLIVAVEDLGTHPQKNKIK
jgi:hypothetical protein